MKKNAKRIIKLKSSDLARIAESVIREMDEMGIDPEMDDDMMNDDEFGGEEDFEDYGDEDYDTEMEDDMMGGDEFAESYRRRRRPMKESRRRARIRRIVRETLRRRKARAMKENRRRQRYHRSNW